MVHVASVGTKGGGGGVGVARSIYHIGGTDLIMNTSLLCAILVVGKRW